MDYPHYSPFEAHLVCALLSITYVASLYLIPKEIRLLPRNNTTHVSDHIHIACSAHDT